MRSPICHDRAGLGSRRSPAVTGTPRESADGRGQPPRLIGDSNAHAIDACDATHPACPQLRCESFHIGRGCEHVVVDVDPAVFVQCARGCCVSVMIRLTWMAISLRVSMGMSTARPI